MGVRAVRPKDVSRVADIFIAAFPESISHYYSDRPVPSRGFLDIYSFLAWAERGSFLVYEDETSGTVLGYIVVPRTMTSVWVKAFLSGRPLVWAFNWLTGQYGISANRVLAILWNKVLFARSSREQLAHGHAQILSVAVHPSVQGRGIGRELVRHGLDLLRSQGVSTVKLEVRPNNQPAKRIYLSLGFKEVGTSQDSQGEWTVMAAHLQPQPTSPGPCI